MLFQLAAFVMAAALVSSISASRIRTTVSSARISLAGFRGMISMPDVIMIVIYCTASFGAILAVYPAFLTEKGASAVHVEILYFAFGVSRIITLLYAKKFAAHPAATLIIAVLAISVGMSAAYFGDGLLWYAVALLVMGFGFSAVVPLTLEIALSRVKTKVSGSLIGAYESIFGVGWVLGPIIAGTVSHVYGGSMPYMVFAAAGFCVALSAVFRRSTLRPTPVQD